MKVTAFHNRSLLPASVTVLVSIASMNTTTDRRELLKAVYQEARGCVALRELAATRTTVVFGCRQRRRRPDVRRRGSGRERGPSGPAVRRTGGEAVGLLLGEIGLARSDVFVANTLKCRPPGNRDPQPIEIDTCPRLPASPGAADRAQLICRLGTSPPSCCVTIRPGSHACTASRRCA